MSVFTALTEAEIRQFLDAFPLGALQSWQGISAGSENSNFFLHCEGGDYVLTLVERGPVEQLPFLVELLQCLHEAKLPVPYVMSDRQGRALHSLRGRPALLQPKLPGDHIEQPSAAHCAEVGRHLARLHEAAAGMVQAPGSDRGPDWVLDTSRVQLESGWRDEASWLAPVLDALDSLRQQDLPCSVIHGDLFRDNVLFVDKCLSGLIDFHNAARGWDLLDLAICANDWCLTLDATPQHDVPRLEALLEAYQERRELTEIERHCWPMMLQLAALRFWLSRQLASDAPPEGGEVLIKNPGHFRQLLSQLAHGENVAIRHAL